MIKAIGKIRITIDLNMNTKISRVNVPLLKNVHVYISTNGNSICEEEEDTQ